MYPNGELERSCNFERDPRIYSCKTITITTFPYGCEAEPAGVWDIRIIPFDFSCLITCPKERFCLKSKMSQNTDRHSRYDSEDLINKIYRVFVLHKIVEIKFYFYSSSPRYHDWQLNDEKKIAVNEFTELAAIVEPLIKVFLLFKNVGRTESYRLLDFSSATAVLTRTTVVDRKRNR